MVEGRGVSAMAMCLPSLASDERSRGGRIVELCIAISLAFGVGLPGTFGTAAHAADTTIQWPLKAPPAPATSYFDWTGFYVGGHVGYSRGNARVTLADPDPTHFGHSFGSLTGGLQGGYNYVLPSRFLLGIEADASFLNYLSADDVPWFPPPPCSHIAA